MYKSNQLSFQLKTIRMSDFNSSSSCYEEYLRAISISVQSEFVPWYEFSPI